MQTEETKPQMAMDFLVKKLNEACIELARYKVLWSEAQNKIKKLEAENARLRLESH